MRGVGLLCLVILYVELLKHVCRSSMYHFLCITIAEYFCYTLIRMDPLALSYIRLIHTVGSLWARVRGVGFIYQRWLERRQGGVRVRVRDPASS